MRCPPCREIKSQTLEINHASRINHSFSAHLTAISTQQLVNYSLRNKNQTLRRGGRQEIKKLRFSHLHSDWLNQWLKNGIFSCVLKWIQLQLTCARRLWTAFIQSMHYSCQRACYRPLPGPLSFLCRPKQLYCTLAPNTISFIVHGCSKLENVT